MNRKGYISRTIAPLLLIVTLYMYACSGLCAVGSSVCCGKDAKSATSTKACCDHKEKARHNEKDCYDLHSSFFSATGQFSPEKALNSFTVFQNIVALLPSANNIYPVEQNQAAFAYNGFYSPPPRTDIRLLIQSFQI